MLGEDILSQIPAEPPRSPDLLPGLRLSRAGLWRSVMPLVFVLVLSLMPAVVFMSDRGAMLAIRRTRTAEGRVERTEQVPRRAGGGRRIEYSFSAPDGVPYRGEDTAPARTTYSRVDMGDSLPITFVESDPATTRSPVVAP